MTMNSEDLQTLIEGLRSLRGESEWVEFKFNYDDPDEIGEYISALRTQLLNGVNLEDILFGGLRIKAMESQARSSSQEKRWSAIKEKMGIKNLKAGSLTI